MNWEEVISTERYLDRVGLTTVAGVRWTVSWKAGQPQRRASLKHVTATSLCFHKHHLPLLSSLSSDV
jgi:hypothetical protein